MDFEYGIRSRRISTNDLKTFVNFKNFILGKIRDAKGSEDLEQVAALEMELAQVNQDMSPLLKQYELELEANHSSQLREKGEFRKKLANAFEVSQKCKAAANKRKEYQDSDDEGGKDRCFTLKAPKLTVRDDFIFPSFNPLTPKPDLDLVPMTSWEEAAAKVVHR